ncbi:MAG: alpha/beta hydrolase [Candidatus Zixiibacteriota bacterium]|nr:MAG: alpha/beta hydrolase [candidate division Zixibacteria bacterium]
MKALRMLFWLVIFTVSVFAVMSAYLYFNQKNMVFFPVRELAFTPDQINLTFEDLILDGGDGSAIHGWYFPPNAENGRVFLFCHGNAGNISHRLETIEFLLNLNAAVLIFDYRGYGRSTGEPTEEGIYSDARLCYDWLIDKKGFRTDDILIFGRSLGGAVAIDLASKVSCGGLIVESSFTSAAGMARRIFPILPTTLLLRYHFDSQDKVAKVKCPVVITHSPDDEMIPFSMGEKLYRSAAEPKQFVRLSGGHNDREYLQKPEYIEAFRRLLQSNRPGD